MPTADDRTLWRRIVNTATLHHVDATGEVTGSTCSVRFSSVQFSSHAVKKASLSVGRGSPRCHRAVAVPAFRRAVSSRRRRIILGGATLESSAAADHWLAACPVTVSASQPAADNSNCRRTGVAHAFSRRTSLAACAQQQQLLLKPHLDHATGAHLPRPTYQTTRCSVES